MCQKSCVLPRCKYGLLKKSKSSRKTTQSLMKKLRTIYFQYFQYFPVCFFFQFFFCFNLFSRYLEKFAQNGVPKISTTQIASQLTALSGCQIHTLLSLQP